MMRVMLSRPKVPQLETIGNTEKVSFEKLRLGREKIKFAKDALTAQKERTVEMKLHSEVVNLLENNQKKTILPPYTSNLK